GPRRVSPRRAGPPGRGAAPTHLSLRSASALTESAGVPGSGKGMQENLSLVAPAARGIGVADGSARIWRHFVSVVGLGPFRYIRAPDVGQALPRTSNSSTILGGCALAWGFVGGRLQRARVPPTDPARQ